MHLSLSRVLCAAALFPLSSANPLPTPPHPRLAATAGPTAADDLSHLQSICEHAAHELDDSLLNAPDLDTAALIQNVTVDIQTYTANFTMTSFNATHMTPAALDGPYADYAGSLETLASSTSRRGRSYHNEDDVPVYQALQALARAVRAHAQKLPLTDNAFSRSIQAGWRIVAAESAWTQNTGSGMSG